MLTYPSSEELLTLGLCQICLNSPPYTLNGGETIQLGTPAYAGPAAVSQLPAFTAEEIETALEALNDNRS